MSTTTPQPPSQNEWLIHIPDHASSLSKRLAARPAHLTNLKPRIASGQVVFGGATLSSQPQPGEQPQMTGSMMLIKAETEEEVRNLLQEDEYTKQGAWDIENAKVWAFKCAVRTGL